MPYLVWSGAFAIFNLFSNFKQIKVPCFWEHQLLKFLLSLKQTIWLCTQVRSNRIQYHNHKHPSECIPVPWTPECWVSFWLNAKNFISPNNIPLETLQTCQSGVIWNNWRLAPICDWKGDIWLTRWFSSLLSRCTVQSQRARHCWKHLLGYEETYFACIPRLFFLSGPSSLFFLFFLVMISRWQCEWVD